MEYEIGDDPQGLPDDPEGMRDGGLSGERLLFRKQAPGTPLEREDVEDEEDMPPRQFGEAA